MGSLIPRPDRSPVGYKIETMSLAFSRSLRALDAERRRLPRAAIGLGAALAGLWTCWLFLGRVEVVEVAEEARIEVEQPAYAVEAQVGGRVVASHLALDKAVREGDVLLELDTLALALALDEERIRQEAIPAELDALRAEIGAQEEARSAGRQAAVALGAEARARSREAEVAAEFSEHERQRSTALRENGLLSEADARKSEAESAGRQAAAEAARLSIGRVASELRITDSERRAGIARLRRAALTLAADQVRGAAAIKKLEHDIDLRRIRAPAGGRLGEIATLQPGSVVREGDRIGVVIPPETLRVVAHFAPQAAIGRVRTGQPARVRLDGFPWTQYGTLAATVAGVGSEPRDGRVRVELTVQPDAGSGIPLVHGLPGSVEVEVERVSPAMLALRAAGGLGAPAGR
jgi:membrane fusion protein (multidrug efflux system)